jgi:hypothetical protein
MAWHLEAVGSGGVRGTGDKKTMALAASSTTVVDSFGGAVLEVRVPPHREGGLAHLQDQVRHGRSPLLPEGLGQVRPGVRLRRRREPDGARRRRGRVRVGALLPEHLPETHKGGQDKKGTGNLPGAAKTREEGRKPDKAKKLAPKEFTENQKGMVTAFNRYVCYIKPPRTTRRRRSSTSRSSTPARAPTSRPSTGRRRPRLPRRRDEPRRQATSASTRAALPRVAQHPRHALSSPRAPPATTTWRSDVPKFIELYCTAQGEGQRRAVRDPHPHPARHRAPPAEKLVEAAASGGPDALEAVREGRERVLGACGRSTARSACKPSSPPASARRDPLQRGSRVPGGSPDREGDRGAEDPHRPEATTSTRPSLAKKAVYEIGGNYQAIAVYDEAAAGTSGSPRENPKMEKAPRPSRTPSSSASASARKTRRSRTPSCSRRTTARRSPRRPRRSRSRSAPTTPRRKTGRQRAQAPRPSALGQIDRQARSRRADPGARAARPRLRPSSTAPRRRRPNTTRSAAYLDEPGGPAQEARRALSRRERPQAPPPRQGPHRRG